MTALYIGVFGITGVFLRYGVDLALSSRFPSFPINTLLVNAIGCLVAGFIYSLGTKELLSSPLQTGLLVGLCGGFTTFSAYALQSLLLVEKGQINLMLINFLLSPILGFAAVYAGYFGSRFFIR